jgi:hypothetical protein
MRNARIETIIHISEPQSDLLQLVDLVVGATQASQTTTRIPVTNSTKRDVIRYLMKKFGVTSFEKNYSTPDVRSRLYEDETEVSGKGSCDSVTGMLSTSVPSEIYIIPYAGTSDNAQLFVPAEA